MADGSETLIYAEAIRGIERQQSVIEGLRSRAGTLFGAASLATAFLGGQVLTRNPDFTVSTSTAIVAFVVMFILVLSILWPWNFRFVLSATILLEDHRDKSPADLQAYLAEIWDRNYELNQPGIARMNLIFRGACLALSIEIVAWLVSLGRG
jgi:hypothetical protein